MRFLGRLAFLITLLATCLSTIQAYAWDQHHLLTQNIVLGFKFKDKKLWSNLNSSIEVHSFERFIERAFGSTCSIQRMRDDVLEGVGEKYSVHFTSGAAYHMTQDWDAGTSQVEYIFFPTDPNDRNPQAVGERVTPTDVLSIYSDEPDWFLDDDVPRLKDVGITKGIVGTGTRVLRHFWYEGESQAGVDLASGQELDRRIQLLYELSLVAFSVDEHYWGYRFLANALHYLEDLTQPFHVKAVISDDMIYMIDVLRSALCDFQRHNSTPEDWKNSKCTPEQTIDKALIRSGWLVGTYHSIYEDFGRGLLETYMHSSSDEIIDQYGVIERNGNVEKLIFTRDSNSGLMALREVIRQVQKVTLNYTSPIADSLYKTFGNDFRYNVKACQKELFLGGKSSSSGYQMALASFYDIPLTQRQREAKAELLENTHSLFQKSGIWGRDFLRNALMDSQNPKNQKSISDLREKFALRCSSAKKLPIRR